MNPIYLDHNATTPIAPEVAEEMRPYIYEYYGNPSSAHCFGTKTKQAIEIARKQVAALINCKPAEIIFTSGGTESNNYALKGFAFSHSQNGKHIITSAIEHPAILEVCKYLEKQGSSISYLPVNQDGIIRINDLEKEIRNDTILISIMHANNEVGSTQPMSEIVKIAKKYDITLHTDAAQSLGKIAIDVQQMRIDMLSIAGHKLYAPKGIGALYVKNGIQLEKLIHGADHEHNLRAGTENVLGIVGLGFACDIAKRDLDKNIAHYKACRDLLQKEILKEFPSAKINGHPINKLPNTLSISFPTVEANTLVSKLKNTAISAGAACHSENIKISNVLDAMHIPIEFAMGTVRLSTGISNTLTEMKLAAKDLISTVKSLLP